MWEENNARRVMPARLLKRVLLSRISKELIHHHGMPCATEEENSMRVMTLESKWCPQELHAI
jgi:hypothetical protein